jgi:hypothetical protein
MSRWLVRLEGWWGEVMWERKGLEVVWWLARSDVGEVRI